MVLLERDRARERKEDECARMNQLWLLLGSALSESLLVNNNNFFFEILSYKSKTAVFILTTNRILTRDTQMSSGPAGNRTQDVLRASRSQSD